MTLTTTAPQDGLPAAQLELTRVVLRRTLLLYARLRLPPGDAYSSGMVERLVLRLLASIDANLAEFMAGLELEGAETP